MGYDEGRAARQHDTIKRLLAGINDDKKQQVPGVLADDAVAHDGTLDANLDSLEKYREFGDRWIEAIENYRLDLVQFFSNGLEGVFVFNWTGNITSKKNGKTYPISIPGVSVVEFTEDDLVKSETAYFDFPEMLRQLDLPNPSLVGLLQLIGLEDTVPSVGA